MSFVLVPNGRTPSAYDVNAIIQALEGIVNAGQPISLTALSDAANYALDLRNLGTGGLGLRVKDSAGNTVLLAKDTGVTVGTLAGYIKGTAGILSGQVGVPWGDLTSVPSTFAPSAHASAHHSGGGDALSLGSIAGNVSTSQHGSLGTISNAHAWADINKATSSIADITTRSHTSLTDIGTNAHSAIDTHIGATGTSAHGLGDVSTRNVGTTAGTAAAGDDSRFVSNGNSHDHSGGDGAQIDHGGLAGLADDDHTQYVLKSGSLTQITTRSHTALSDIGTNAHSAIDTHIGATGSSVHGLGSISTQAANSVAITGGSITGLTALAQASGIFYLNDTANSNMTTGITVNQGSADDQLFAGKSSDVTHGCTGIAETDTWIAIRKNDPAIGGAIIDTLRAAGGGASSALFRAISGADDTTHTSAGEAKFRVVGYNISAGNAANVAANTNIFGVEANGGARFLVDAEGDLFADGSDVTVYDEYDDAAMLRAFDLTRGKRGIIESEWDRFVQYNEDDLVRVGILGAPRAQGGLINYTLLARFQNGAIWQLNTKLQSELASVKERLALTEQRLAALTV